METKHLPYLTSLRGIAELMVVFVHALNFTYLHHAGILNIYAHGAHGVQLFFIISALTLFLSLSSRQEQGFREYFIRRFFRIAPLFWLLLIVYAVLNFRAEYGPDMGTPNTWPYLLSAFSFLSAWHPDHIRTVIPVGWSVGVEVAFYALVPFLFLWLTDLRKSIIAFALALYGGHWITLAAMRFWPTNTYADECFYYWWLPNQLAVFLLGIVVFYAIKQTALLSEERKRNIGFLLLLAAGLLLLHLFGQPMNPTLRGSDVSIFAIPQHVQWALAFGLLVVGVSLRPVALLVNGFTRYVGTVSYSMYLLHFAVYPRVDSLVYSLRQIGIDLQPVELFVVPLSVIAITLGVATITHRFIEVPGMALGRRLIAALATRAASRQQQRSTPHCASSPSTP